jgi:DNA primase
VHRIRELTALRQIDDLRSRLQRTNPADDQEAYDQMFADLVALEQRRRHLNELARESE